MGEKPRLRGGGPASGNRGGLVAPRCKNNHKLVCDLCPPRGSEQYGGWEGDTLPFVVVWGKSLQ